MPEEFRQPLEGWKATQTLRARPPRTARPEIILTGDGSVEGTNIAWPAGFEPLMVKRITIDLDADKRDQLAAGKVFHYPTNNAESLAELDVWVRFGNP